MITYATACSGIEAPSVAWAALGWQLLWVSEIEPAPCEHLAYHYPDAPNAGDLLLLADKVRAGVLPAPDVFIAGTPCQAFSFAGLRGSLSDPRGQLTRAYIEVFDAINDVRGCAGQPGCVALWENVPGVLSTKDNAFGHVLGGLVHAGGPVRSPAGSKWARAGFVSGPGGTAAWRVLDAQYFGVAQRRKRVFVVASARDGFDPCSVLFERDGMRRDTAPLRSPGQDPAGTLDAGIGRRRGSGQNPNALTAQVGFEVAGTLEARTRGGGFPGSDGSMSGHVVAATIGTKCGRQDRGEASDNLIPHAGCWWDGGQTSQTLDAVLYKGQTMPDKNRFPAVLQPKAFAENSRAELRLEGGDGAVTGALSRGGGKPGQGTPMIAFPANLSATQHASSENLAPSMGAKNPTAVTTIDWRVRRLMPIECERLQGFPDNHTLIPLKSYAVKVVSTPSQRRRGHYKMRVVERCRYSSDSDRYKAIGNSMAVPVIRWLGERVQAHLGGEF